MASLQIEVASSSSPFSYSLRDHNHSKDITGYMTQCIRKNKAHDADEDSSWLPSHISNTDDSWLPAVTSKSDASHRRKGQTDVDDSWLPTNNDTKGKGWTNASEPKKDIDYSWLPSTFIDKKEKKQKNDKIKEKNTNKTNTNTKNSNNIINNIKSNDNCNTNSNSSSSSKTNTDSGAENKSKNNHWALAREVVFSCDQHTQNDEQHDSSSKSKYTVESPSSVGVSSLLRRWSALAEAKNSKENDTMSPSCNRSNLGSTCKDNKSNSPSGDGFRDCKSYGQSPPSTTKDSDWESDKTSSFRRLSCPLPSRDNKDSNASEVGKEKIRVVDIIKKLSKEEELAASNASGNGNESLPRIRTSLDNQQIMEEHNKGFKGVKVSRRLIRGRQTFNDFLVLNEHDKDRELKWLLERKAVSKFSHRGRLQALLRFKFLRLEAEPKPKVEAKRHKRCVSKTLDKNNRVDIMDLRERFDSRSEKGAAKSRKHKSVMMNIQNEELFSTPTGSREVEFKTKTKTKTTSNMKQEPPPKVLEPMTPHTQLYQTNSCKYVGQTTKDVNFSSNSIMWKERCKDDNKYEFQEDEGQFMSAKTSYSQIEDRGISDSEDTIYTAKKHAENYEDWMTSEYSQTRSDLDENESYDMQLLDTNYDWISEISRPKSDWEDMRQARYEEMLERSSGNVDIRRLLERKTVSSFLSSSLRDLIDNVMMSRIQQSHVQVGKPEVVVAEKSLSRKELEYSEFADQTPYSERLWRPNLDGIYNSETTTTTTTTSPSLERSPLSNRSQNNSSPQSSPAVTHPSAEMELIYDLRGHMEQLHQEIMELRRSIKGCVNMQVKMQLSIKQNVVADAATRSVQKKDQVPPGVGKTCSICGDMQIDSLLYRCGHMCACFNCAVELQRTCGECPVCEAPIVDVVRAFVHLN